MPKRWSAYERADRHWGIMMPDGKTPATNGQVIPEAFSEVSEGKKQPYWNGRLDIVLRHVNKLNEKENPQ